MTTTEQIREALDRAMSDSPEPRPWAEVQRRAMRRDTDDSTPRSGRTLWLAVASLVVVLVGGLTVLGGLLDDAGSRPDDVAVDDPDPTTPREGSPGATPATTDAVSSTAPPAAGAVWNFGLLGDVDAESLRPLESLTRDDVVVPTAPASWRLWNPTVSSQGDDDDPDLIESEFSVIEALPDGSTGPRIDLTLTRFPVCGPTSPGCSSSETTTTVNGVAWQTFLETDGVRAEVGGWWIEVRPVDIDLAGPMLEDPTILDFLEGLRVGTPEDLIGVGGACFDCVSDSGPVAPEPTSVDPLFVPRDVDDEVTRPLADLTEDDVVVPGYVPDGMVFDGPAYLSADEFFYSLASGGAEPSAISVRQWPTAVQYAGGPDGRQPIERELSSDPDHPLVEIAGITWGWDDFESARYARIGSSEVFVSVRPDDDETEMVRFIEGLRAAPINHFPGPIRFDDEDGLSIVDGAIERAAEVVATDPEFELSAVRIGDQVCTRLRQTTVPVTAGFAADCSAATRFDDSVIVDFYGVGGPDDPDAVSLIIGSVDSPDITEVQITSPTGETVVVDTGPTNQAIDGRFFLARLPIDSSNGVRLDRFTIEDASP